MMKKIRLIILLLFCSLQIIGVQAQEPASDTSVSALPVGISIYVDPRLDILIEQYSQSYMKGARSSQGYRIQIYNGSDKQKAISTKIDFMQRYPSIPSYMSYVQPNFKIKVGNFYNRQAALELQKELRRIYPHLMIVPDIIVTSKHDTTN